jgi:hypothetical protein
LQISIVCCQFTLCGEASSKRLPGINPAGYDSQTGYQYDSISRVAGHRELAPPSKFSKLGGFNSKVFITSGILHPQFFVSQCNPVIFPYSRTCTPYIRYGRACDLFKGPQHLDNSLPDLVAYAQFFLQKKPFLHQNTNGGRWPNSSKRQRGKPSGHPQFDSI